MALSKPAGSWTYDDLLSLPDDGRRYEIIEGVLYELPPPTWDHATSIMNVILLLGPIVSAMEGRIATAPLDTFFQGADPVQPDILVILPGCRAVGEGRGVQGPPDLLVEVLSPSNRGHNLLTKRALYARAGVQEYWIVDPLERAVEVLALDRDAFHTVQIASGDDAVSSRLLPDATFPLAAIFFGIEGSEG